MRHDPRGTEPTTLALMHDASFQGDGGAQLRNLASAYDERYFAAHAGMR